MIWGLDSGVALSSRCIHSMHAAWGAGAGGAHAAARGLVRRPTVPVGYRRGQGESLLLFDMAAALPTADAVRALISVTETRGVALEAFEAHADPLEPEELRLALASALVEALVKDTEHASFQRTSLLLARLFGETRHDRSAATAVVTAAFGDGRLSAMCQAEDNVLAIAVAKTAEQLTAEDARSYACWVAAFFTAQRTEPRYLSWFHAVLGITFLEAMGLLQKQPISWGGPGGKRELKDAAAALRMHMLLIELHGSQDQPELVEPLIASSYLLWTHPSTHDHLVSTCGLFELVVSSMRKLGHASEWLVSTTTCSLGRAFFDCSIHLTIWCDRRAFQTTVHAPEYCGPRSQSCRKRRRLTLAASFRPAYSICSSREWLPMSSVAWRRLATPTTLQAVMSWSRLVTLLANASVMSRSVQNVRAL
eukprot:COSAG02_NODE_5674_length_4138_cov_472.361228_4_plen_422_part_00